MVLSVEEVRPRRISMIVSRTQNLLGKAKYFGECTPAAETNNSQSGLIHRSIFLAIDEDRLNR